MFRGLNLNEEEDDDYKPQKQEIKEYEKETSKGKKAIKDEKYYYRLNLKINDIFEDMQNESDRIHNKNNKKEVNI